MKLQIVYEPSEEGGYTAYVPSLPGCISEGDTFEEAKANIKEAIELYLELVEDDVFHPDSVVELVEVPYTEILFALQRGGWVVVRQKGSHIRLHKRVGSELLKITVPAHKPVKRSTLSHILKQARLSAEEFLELL